MQKFATLNDAIALAEFAHRNQLDKAGFPYVEHPKRVLANVQAMGAAPYVQIAAVLHDVTEDTRFTPQMLLDLGVPEAAVNIVKLVDRGRSAEIYKNTGDTRLGLVWVDSDAEYVMNMTQDEYYYACIRENPGALQVKRADISDNTLPWRLTYLDEETQTRLKKKYANALTLLGQ